MYIKKDSLTNLTNEEILKALKSSKTSLCCEVSLRRANRKRYQHYNSNYVGHLALVYLTQFCTIKKHRKYIEKRNKAYTDPNIQTLKKYIVILDDTIKYYEKIVDAEKANNQYNTLERFME